MFFLLGRFIIKGEDYYGEVGKTLAKNHATNLSELLPGKCKHASPSPPSGGPRELCPVPVFRSRRGGELFI